ncbi:MAG TPA: PfkB family carbohydrate kinase, partial [Paracoccaceae bacterium]|nr:PfkB family carbohydrate kinase [Paracoccaceae bacterium]
IAGGSTDTLAALRNVRAVSGATLVCKRGPMGAVAFTGPIPARLEDGIAGQGFPVEVFNVLGAGDGFMAGLLRGWLRGEDWPTSLKFANACGAFAVSRHGCTPAYPTWEELQFFFRRGIVEPALRKDAELEHVHWATTRRGIWATMRVLAFDHRAQIEDLARETGADPARIPDFKGLCLRAALDVARGRSGYGILCDERLGRDALHEAAGTGLWIGRPVERPGSRPLELEIGPDLGSDLAEWPVEQVVKVLVFYHPDDDAAMKARQEEAVVRLADAARRQGLEFLLEIIPSKVGPVTDETVAAVIRRFYALGVRPDWWKLEPMVSAAAWDSASAAIAEGDPWCRGIVVLGLAQSEERLVESFRVAARQPLVKGFAVGRTIFEPACRAWLAGRIGDAEAVADMAMRFGRLAAAWDAARLERGDAA